MKLQTNDGPIPKMYPDFHITSTTADDNAAAATAAAATPSPSPLSIEKIKAWSVQNGRGEAGVDAATEYLFARWQEFDIAESERRARNREREKINRKRQTYNAMRNQHGNGTMREKKLLTLLPSRCLFCGNAAAANAAAMEFRMRRNEYSMRCTAQPPCVDRNLVISRNEMTTLDAKLKDIRARLESIMEKVSRLKLDLVFEFVELREATTREEQLLQCFTDLYQQLEFFVQMKKGLLTAASPHTNADVAELEEQLYKAIERVKNELGEHALASTDTAPGATSQKHHIEDVVSFVLRELMPLVNRLRARLYEEKNGSGARREFCRETNSLIITPLDFRWTEIWKDAYLPGTPKEKPPTSVSGYIKT